MIVRSCRWCLFSLNRLSFDYLCFFYCFLLIQVVQAQETFKYDSLYQLIVQSESDQKLLEKHLRLFLSEAKEDENREEIVYGYRNYMQYLDSELGILYADSMIYAAQQTNDNNILGSAYLSKGIYHYGRKDHFQALNDYLQAKDYLSETDNQYLQYKVNYNIGNIQYFLGLYEEAIALFEECIGYFKSTHSRAYLNSLHLLALCHTRMGNIGKSEEIIEIGLAEGERLDIYAMEHYFNQLKGINHYFKDNYGLALEKLLSVLPLLESKQDFANVSIANFYIGESYWTLKNINKALFHFRKVDEIFVEKNYIRDDLRKAYELLILDAKENDNLEAQLYYLEQLIQADRVLDYQYRQVSQKIHRQYDHQKIHAEKEYIHKQLEKKRQSERLLVYAVVFLLVLFVVVLFIHFHIRRLYTKRYREWGNKASLRLTSLSKTSLANQGACIPEKTLLSIQSRLEKFEKDHKFMDKALTLSKLASTFGTNPKYLSSVIKQSKGQNFSEYINGLKIDFFLGLLKSNRRLKNYTHKAMADEAGFSSAPRFTSAFKKHTGISLSFYIEQMKEEGTKE